MRRLFHLMLTLAVPLSAAAQQSDVASIAARGGRLLSIGSADEKRSATA